MFAIVFRLFRRFRLPGLLCCLLFFFTGCGTVPQIDRQEYTSRDRLIQNAESRVADARSQSSPIREQTLVAAAQLFLQAESRERAEHILQALNPALMQPETLADYSLTYADIALADDRFFLARDLLTYPRLESVLAQLPMSSRKGLHERRANLFALLGEEQSAVPEYRQLTTLLTDPAEIVQVHDKLWQALSHVPQTNLENMAATAVDSDLQGWYRLALLTRQHTGDISGQLQQINAWKSLNPNHAAARFPPTSLRRAEEAINALPRHIALLLPFSGEFRTAANTIRDGFFAAYYRVLSSTGSPPEVRLYDTGSDDIQLVFNNAVADGAELVIGPLRKEELAKLASPASLPVPVVALNYLDEQSTAPAGLYQFGLAIADEARQAAERAWIEGQRTALVITPDTSWGKSALTAFREAWQQKGGSLIETPAYATDLPDFSPLLKPALLLDQSDQRASRLERTLGKNVEYEPRRRQDLDMVFMVAYPNKGRQIKPTLDFLFAGDLQIYATSHIYDGVPDPGKDRDLEGVRFSAMPWTLPGESTETMVPVATLAPAYRNLFAMGIDAYQLHQWVGLMSVLPDTELHGNTGRIRLGRDNRLQRTQPWGEFRYSRVRAAPQLGPAAGAADNNLYTEPAQ